MVYAANAKHSCFTGFWKNRNPKKTFDHEDFVKEQALAGPNSTTSCIIHK